MKILLVLLLVLGVCAMGCDKKTTDEEKAGDDVEQVENGDDVEGTGDHEGSHDHDHEGTEGTDTE